MNFEKIKNYFIPQKILDIGANIGGFYIRCKKASEVLGVNMHPVRREKIQEDILFINQNI